MAYAHTNIAIKPVYDVDFTPAPFIVAAAAEGKSAAQEPERPPTLKPAAADKLLDLADQLQAALRSAGSGGQVAALTVSGAPSGNL